jgi:hypothetical protein
MKKAIMFFSIFLYAIAASSHQHFSHLDYSIVFGGCFENDLVSLKINKRPVLKSFQVENRNAIKKGNLSLTQSPDGITLFYNGTEIKKSGVRIGFLIDIEVEVNKQVKKFKVDLRKGKVVVIENCTANTTSKEKKITLEQLQEPMIFM